jgi:hypothetical protein
MTSRFCKRDLLNSGLKLYIFNHIQETKADAVYPVHFSKSAPQITPGTGLKTMKKNFCCPVLSSKVVLNVDIFVTGADSYGSAGEESSTTGRLCKLCFHFRQAQRHFPPKCPFRLCNPPLFPFSV